MKIPGLKYFNYINAWLKYIGEIFTRLANISNVVRDTFADLHLPKKEEYLKDD